MKVPFLGEVPLDPAIRRSGDDGEPVVSAAPERGNVVNLMDALKASLQDSKPAAKRATGAKKKPAAKKKSG